MFYTMNRWGGNFAVLKLNPALSAQLALAKIAPVFQKHNPSAPFDYQFVDAEYGKKFAAELRVGRLAGFFAILAVFISCLGLFGLASFMAEQRTKEIGISRGKARKYRQNKQIRAGSVNFWQPIFSTFSLRSKGAGKP